VTVPAFGWNTQALSASPLSHAERPLGRAFLLYPAFSCGVQRNRTTAVAGVLTGGLPLGRLGWFMAPIMWLQISLDKWATGVFNVATLNKEEGMKLTKKEQAELKRLRRLWMAQRATVAQIQRVRELQRRRDAVPEWKWA
jgi:hypothetical protein